MAPDKQGGICQLAVAGAHARLCQGQHQGLVAAFRRAGPHVAEAEDGRLYYRQVPLAGKGLVLHVVMAAQAEFFLAAAVLEHHYAAYLLCCGRHVDAIVGMVGKAAVLALEGEGEGGVGERSLGCARDDTGCARDDSMGARGGGRFARGDARCARCEGRCVPAGGCRARGYPGGAAAGQRQRHGYCAKKRCGYCMARQFFNPCAHVGMLLMWLSGVCVLWSCSVRRRTADWARNCRLEGIQQCLAVLNG